MEAYAHYGKGLIIYDGFDNDQAYSVAYRQLVGRELAQGVNPDNLLCSARLGDFVITTEQRLKSQVMVPGRTYTYPLTLLSNQGYSGTIRLSLTSTPPDPTMTYRFEPDTIALSEIAQAMLTVQTTHESLSAGRALSIRGTDAQPRSNAVCVQLTERKTGGIQVVSSFHPSKKPSRRSRASALAASTSGIATKSASMRASENRRLMRMRRRWRTTGFTATYV